MCQQNRIGGWFNATPPRLKLISAVILIMTAIAFAQPDTLWTSYYNDGYDNGNAGWSERCYRLIKTNNGGFLIGGQTFTPGGNRQRYPAYYIVKTDADGVEEWTGVYDVGIRHDMLCGIALRENGQFFIAGYYVEELWKANIIKIDANGDSLWSRDYEDYLFHNMISTSDHGILACGSGQAHLVKVDEDGELIWRRTYDGGGDEIFLDVVETHDNGYAAVGWVWASVCLILKTDANGEQEWLRTYNFTDSTETLLCVEEVPGGGYIAGGWFDSNHSLLARFDTDGDTIWAQRDVQRIEREIKDIAPASGGGWIIVGKGRGRHGGDVYKTKRIDDLGEEVWELGIEFDDDASFDEATSVLALDDGGYLIGGNRWMRWDGGNSAGLIRTEPDTVVLPFELGALAESHDFGDSVMVDSVVTWELPVHNFGRRYVPIDSVAITGDSSAFAYDMELPLYLYPPDTTYILVGFSPDSVGDYAAEFIFFYGDSQTVSVSLTGRGIFTNEVSGGTPLLPTQLALEPVWPNPFNGVVHICYALPNQMLVKVTVHDVSGREVVRLFNGVEQAGIRNRTWTATNMPTGIYFLKITAGGEVATTKVILLK